MDAESESGMAGMRRRLHAQHDAGNVQASGQAGRANWDTHGNTKTFKFYEAASPEAAACAAAAWRGAEDASGARRCACCNDA